MRSLRSISPALLLLTKFDHAVVIVITLCSRKWSSYLIQSSFLWGHENVPHLLLVSQKPLKSLHLYNDRRALTFLLDNMSHPLQPQSTRILYSTQTSDRRAVAFYQRSQRLPTCDRAAVDTLMLSFLPTKFDHAVVLSPNLS